MAVFVVFICKKTTLDKIVRYLKGGERGVVNGCIAANVLKVSSTPFNIPINTTINTIRETHGKEKEDMDSKGNIIESQNFSETLGAVLELGDTMPATSLKKRSIKVNTTTDTSNKDSSRPKDLLPYSSIKKRSIIVDTTQDNCRKKRSSYVNTLPETSVRKDNITFNNSIKKRSITGNNSLETSHKKRSVDSSLKKRSIDIQESLRKKSA